MKQVVDINAVLENTRAMILSKTTEKVEKRIERYRPVIEDYLNGMLVSEIASKHNTTRYQVYSLLDRYYVPKRSVSDLRLYYTRKLLGAHPRMNKKLREKECDCELAQWVKRHVPIA